MPRGGCRENAGRKSTWSNSETKLIRVPTALASQLLELAQKLDKGETIDFVTKSEVEPETVVVPVQLALLEGESKKQSLSPLSGRALAVRLRIHNSNVIRHRQRKNSNQFLEWSRSIDPQGYGWAYNEAEKLYYCVL